MDRKGGFGEVVVVRILHDADDQFVRASVLRLEAADNIAEVRGTAGSDGQGRDFGHDGIL